MSRDDGGTAGFERQLHALLQESVARVGGHARSRLNQARHAALAEAPRRLAAGRIRRRVWLPLAGAVAAALGVAVLMWPQAPQGYPAAEASRTPAQDLELLADRDGMELMQSGDGQFYEWALAQADRNGPAAGPGGGPEKVHGGSAGSGDAGRNTG